MAAVRDATRCVVLALSALVIMGCSGDDDGDRADATTTTSERAEEQVVPTTLPSDEATTTASVVPEPPDDTARAVTSALDTVRADLPVTDVEYDCLVDRVAADAPLAAQVSGGVERGSDAYAAVVEAAEWCTRAVTVVPPLVANLEERYGDLTPEQEACIADGYLALPDDELQDLLGVAGDPASPEAAAGRAVIDGVLAVCGVG